MSVLTNRVLLINWIFLFQKKNSILLFFLLIKKLQTFVTNNFLTLNNILFIEVLHFNNFIPFKFTFKLFLPPFLDLYPFQGIPLS
jgi:hypothetical protein